MSWVRETSRRLDAVADRVPLIDGRVELIVAGITLLALLARLILLGDRTAHFDEARVAYWAWYYADTGSFAYRSIIHGPFVQLVTARLIPILGASDFVMRLPVAIVGGLLPAAALLFRAHLRRLEVVILAAILAVNPILLYYSRFMRSDVLVGAFAFVALGFIVRFYDTRRPRFLYGIAGFLALAFASKENALLYLLTWLGAAALLAEGALARPRDHDRGVDLLRSQVATVRARLRGLRERPARWLRGYPLHLAGSLVLFAGLLVFFYAPRGAGYPGLTYQPTTSGGWVGLWEAVGHPTRLPALLDRTLDRTLSQYEYWFDQGGTPPRLDHAAADRLPGQGAYVDRLADYPKLEGAVAKAVELFVAAYVITLGAFLKVLLVTSVIVSAFAILGVLHERYAARPARTLVLLTGLAGAASLLGYTVGTDIFAPWVLVHVILPLSIPAAVGLGRATEWGRSAAGEGDRISLAIMAVLVLVVVGYVGVTVGTTVYLSDQAGDNELVQYAQPGDDFRPAIHSLDRIATTHGNGPDVLVYYGETGAAYGDRESLVHANLTDAAQRSGLAFRPKCIKWFNALPLPWYFAAAGAEVDCLRATENLTALVDSDAPPPMILTRPADDTVPRDRLRQGYSARTYALRAPNSDEGESRPSLYRRVTVWIHEDWDTPSG